MDSKDSAAYSPNCLAVYSKENWNLTFINIDPNKKINKTADKYKAGWT